MATSQAARHALYARLEQVLGDEHADTLMTSLPMETADRLATKEDIGRLEDRMIGLESRFDRLEERMEARFTEFAAEFRSEVREMRKAQQDQFRTYTITMVGSMTALAAIFSVVVGVLG